MRWQGAGEEQEAAQHLNLVVEVGHVCWEKQQLRRVPLNPLPPRCACSKQPPLAATPAFRTHPHPHLQSDTSGGVLDPIHTLPNPQLTPSRRMHS